MKKLNQLFGTKSSSLNDIPLIVNDGTMKYYSNLQPQGKTKSTNFENSLTSDEQRNSFSLRTFDLFQFSSKFDKCLLAVGCTGAVLSGATWPTVIVLDGYLLQNFIDDRNVNIYGPPCSDYIDVSNSSNSSDSENVFQQNSKKLCFGLLIVTVLQFMLNYMMVFSLSVSAHNQIFNIRKRLFKSIFRQEVAWFDSKSVKDFNDIIINDPLSIQKGMGDKFGMMVQTYSIVCTSFFTALFFGWKLSLVLSACMLVTVASKVLIRRIKDNLKDFGVSFETHNKVENISKEVFQSIRTVIAFGGEKKEEERYMQCLDQAQSESVRRGLLSGVESLIFSLCYASTLTLSMWYGITLHLESRCQEEEFLPKNVFIIFAAVWIIFTIPVRNKFYTEEIIRARASAKNVFHIIYREPPIDSYSNRGMKYTQIKGRISFKDVYFAYPHNPKKMILKGLTLEVLPGEIVAILETGGSSSVFLDLLERFYDPLVGQIKIDGKDLRQYNIGWLRDHIGLLGKETTYLKNTVLENIRSNNMKAMYKDVERVSKAIEAHNFIITLPNKYNTILDKNGFPVDKQRRNKIDLARFLLKNPKILLFDLTYFKEEDEKDVLQTIKQITKGRTTVIVTNKLSLIRNIDRIIVLDQGQIKETGNHEELMSNMDIYYHMMKTEIIEEIKEKNEEKCEIETSEQGLVSYQGYHCNVYIPKAETTKKTKKEDFIWDQPIWNLLNTKDSDLPYSTLFAFLIIFHGSAVSALFIVVGNILQCFQQNEKDFQKGCSAVLIFFSIGALISLASMLKTYLNTTICDQMLTRLRKSLFNKIMMQDISYFEENNVDDLCSMLFANSESILKACFSRFEIIVEAVATAITVFVISLSFHPNFGLVLDACTPLLVVSLYFQHKTMHEDVVYSDELPNQSAVEDMKKIRSVASLRYEATIYHQYVSSLEEPAIFTKKFHLLSTLIACSRTTAFMFNTLAMYYGSSLIFANKLNYEDLFKVLLSVAYGTYIMTQVFRYSPDYVLAKFNSRALFKLLESETKSDNFLSDGLIPATIKGDIEFCDLSFHRSCQPDDFKLKDTSFKIKPERTIGLVGSSDSGNTDCINLLEKFYEATKGDILIDGITIQDYDVKWLRSQMGFIPSFPVLFSYTVAGNIAYGDNTRTVPMSEIVEAAKKAGVHDTIKNLPAGYFSSVGDESVHLTAGHYQQIAIARAIVRQPKILLVEDISTKVEKERDKVIHEILNKACEGRTCIIASSRVATVQKADIIYVFHRGIIIENGTHEQLMSMQGHYFKFYIMQNDYSK